MVKAENVFTNKGRFRLSQSRSLFILLQQQIRLLEFSVDFRCGWKLTFLYPRGRLYEGRVALSTG